MQENLIELHKLSISQEQLNEKIQKKAQEIYERSGFLPGRELDNWLEAERIVKKQIGI